MAIQATRPSTSILGGLRQSVADAAQASPSNDSSTGKTDRKPSEYWLNIGFVIPGAGEDGKDRDERGPRAKPSGFLRPAPPACKHGHLSRS